MFLLFIVYIITVPVDSQNKHLVFVLSAVAVCALFVGLGGLVGFLLPFVIGTVFFLGKT